MSARVDLAIVRGCEVMGKFSSCCVIQHRIASEIRAHACYGILPKVREDSKGRLGQSMDESTIAASGN